MINGELKARQTTRMTYDDGSLKREVLSEELLDKNLVLDEEEVLSVLTLPFDCARLTKNPDGRYELTSANHAEKAVFELREAELALRPLRWTNTETVRFLWKKLEIEAVAMYHDFAWQ